jgi:ribosome biogenesis GTPase
MTASSFAGLAHLGLTPERTEAFAPYLADGLMPGRVTATGGTTVAATPDGDVTVVTQRRFRRSIGSRIELPAIGDWLALAPLASAPGSAGVRAVLPRSGTIVRMRLSDGLPQILAANVDIAFLVSGLDHDLNLQRIERYLVIAREGDVEPVVLLNKADVAIDLDAALAAVHDLVGDARVLTISARLGHSLDDMRALIAPGITAVLLGSSGVGKSTITNALLGEERQVVRALRAHDGRGRHTTVHRELFVLDSGGLIIDTPGLRTVGVTGGADGLAESFEDVMAIAASCRFSDCRHESEPGCAVRDAIDAGTLSAERMASFQKLEAERHEAEVRADERARRAAERNLARSSRRSVGAKTKRKRNGP